VHYGAASDRSGRTGAARRGDGANGNAASGLDDVIKPSAISGTFQLTSTSSNEVLSFSASKLNPNDYYTSVASLGGFGQINPHTGVFTLLVPAAGAHGLTFTPGPATGANYAGDAASAFSVPACVADLAQALHDGASWAGTFAPVVGQDAAPLGTCHAGRRSPGTGDQVLRLKFGAARTVT